MLELSTPLGAGDLARLEKIAPVDVAEGDRCPAQVMPLLGG
jgi:hypothetical protein